MSSYLNLKIGNSLFCIKLNLYLNAYFPSRLNVKIHVSLRLIGIIPTMSSKCCPEKASYDDMKFIFC